MGGSDHVPARQPLKYYTLSFPDLSVKREYSNAVLAVFGFRKIVSVFIAQRGVLSCCASDVFFQNLFSVWTIIVSVALLG